MFDRVDWQRFWVAVALMVPFGLAYGIARTLLGCW